MDKLMKYAIQIAMLGRLLDEGLITRKEYKQVKIALQSKQKINKKRLDK
jgi:uncharacterized protein YqgQ